MSGGSLLMERLVKTMRNVHWLPFENTVEHLISSESAKAEIVTTVHGFFFIRGRLLTVRHRERGWECPGGHREPGEGSECAMHRELYEESQGVVSDIFQLGMLRRTAIGPKPENYSRPFPISVSVFYWGNLGHLDDFTGDDEIIERRLVTFQQALMVPWIHRYRELFVEAHDRCLGRIEAQGGDLS